MKNITPPGASRDEPSALDPHRGGPKHPTADPQGGPEFHAQAKKLWIRPSTLIVVALVVAIGAIWWVNHRGADAQLQEMARTRRGMGGMRGGGMNGPLPVVAVPAVKGAIRVTLDGLGTVTPLASVTLRTQISGQLMSVAFQEGQIVHQGDLLAVIDPRPYQVALEQAQGQLIQAEAQLKEAQADLDRYVTLARQDSISQQQVDTQRALVSQYQGLVMSDQAAVDSAKLNLTYCHITAPVTGRVGLRQVDPGNYVTPSDTNGLVVLTQLEPITVIFTLPEDNVADVLAGVRGGAKLAVDAYDRTGTQKLASGTLSTIDNEVDTTTGTFKLRAVFDNDDGILFPNQFVNIRMLLRVERGVIVIPSSAIERGEQGAYVYVVQPNNTVTARAVTLGTQESERVAIASGLSVGERVVTDGADRLREGMQVIVQQGGAAPASPGNAWQHHRHRSESGGGQGGSGWTGSTQAAGTAPGSAPSSGESR